MHIDRQTGIGAEKWRKEQRGERGRRRRKCVETKWDIKLVRVGVVSRFTYYTRLDYQVITTIQLLRLSSY